VAYVNLLFLHISLPASFLHITKGQREKEKKREREKRRERRREREGEREREEDKERKKLNKWRA